MTLSTIWRTSTNTDDATWRSWASAMNTLIVNSGLIYTPCVTDMQFTDEIRPASGFNTSNAAGDNYRVYSFNDVLQATYPVYFRVWYGSGPSNNTYGGIYIQLGMAVDTDTGILSGNGASLGAFGYMPNYATTAGGHYVSTGPDLDCFTFAFGANQGTSYSNNYMSIITFERVPGGIIVLNFCGTGPLRRCGFIPYTGTVPAILSTNGSTRDNIGQFAPVVPKIQAQNLYHNNALCLYPGRAYSPHASYESKQLFFTQPNVLPFRNNFININGRLCYNLGPYYSTQYYSALSTDILDLIMAWD